MKILYVPMFVSEGHGKANQKRKHEKIVIISVIFHWRNVRLNTCFIENFIKYTYQHRYIYHEVHE